MDNENLNMTYKDLVLQKGKFRCKECGSTSFSMKIKGYLDFSLYLEDDQITMDPSFQKEEFDNLDSFFSCNHCLTDYQGALDILQDEAEFEN